MFCTASIVSGGAYLLAAAEKSNPIKIYKNSQETLKCSYLKNMSVACMKFHPLRPSCLFVAFTRNVIKIDVTNESKGLMQIPLIDDDSRWIDDIRDISFNHKDPQLMLTADDDGTIMLLRISTQESSNAFTLNLETIYKVVNLHNIPSSVWFRSDRPLQWYSAGMDGKLVEWCGNSRRCVASYDMIKWRGANNADTSLCVNPPWIWSADVDNTGNIALGLGDGSIVVIPGKKQDPMEISTCLISSSSCKQLDCATFTQRQLTPDGSKTIKNTKKVTVLDNAHEHYVSCVKWISQGTLATCGADGRCLVWQSGKCFQLPLHKSLPACEWLEWDPTSQKLHAICSLHTRIQTFVFV